MFRAFLKIGVMFENLQYMGKDPDLSERLKREESGYAIQGAPSHSRRPRIPSGPLDFWTSILCRALQTSSSVKWGSSIDSSLLVDLSMSVSSSIPLTVSQVNTKVKYLLSAFALSIVDP